MTISPSDSRYQRHSYILSSPDGEISIEDYDLYQQLRDQDFKIFGFDMASIMEIRRQYLKRCGPLDITPKTIAEAFK